MSTPEEVAREALGCHVETVEPGRPTYGTRYCGEHYYGWLHDVDMCPKQERLADLIRARDAEVRAATLAEFTWQPGFRDEHGNDRQLAPFVRREDVPPQLTHSRRLVGPWEPDERTDEERSADAIAQLRHRLTGEEP